MENVDIQLLTSDYQCEALDFVTTQLTLYGPLVSCLSMSKEETSLITSFMIQDALRNGKLCSYLALDKTESSNSIIGCKLNAVCDSWAEVLGCDGEAMKGDQSNKKFEALMNFNNFMWKGINELLPSRYAGPYLRADLGIMHPLHRGRGIWKRMMDTGLERAYKEYRCRYAVALSTNFRAQKYCEESGWKTLRKVNYDDYNQHIREQVFSFPNDRGQVCAKLIMLDIEEWAEERKTSQCCLPSSSSHFMSTKNVD